MQKFIYIFGVSTIVYSLALNADKAGFIPLGGFGEWRAYKYDGLDYKLATLKNTNKSKTVSLDYECASNKEIRRSGMNFNIHVDVADTDNAKAVLDYELEGLPYTTIEIGSALSSSPEYMLNDIKIENLYFYDLIGSVNEIKGNIKIYGLNSDHSKPLLIYTESGLSWNTSGFLKAKKLVDDYCFE